ncbi:uncharacterized protein CDAR_89571 [Caerostris darwini]|uniref:Uncharacterized protein n=1 Tax=Caerostris darwini TaxID=1538125 RepID=A0AAV4VRR4_9ARAC|nr:uncharacterized protein CDAR_89571 [Caerostris darwini]
MIKISLLILASILALVTSNDDYSGCPDSSTLRPCSCLHRPGSNALICTGISKQGILNIFNDTTDWTFFTLLIHRSRINYIPFTSLRSKKFKNILVANSHLNSLFDEDSGVYNGTEIIHLNDVHFDEGLKWTWFRPLKQITYLNLQFMHMPTLGEEVTENLSKGLEHFLMSNTHTINLADGVFRNFNNLLEIKIRNSQVTNLQRTMFPLPSKLQKFDFTANLLQTLPDDLFLNMPHLKVIRLGENRISILSHSVFSIVYQQLDFLDLTGNFVIGVAMAGARRQKKFLKLETVYFLKRKVMNLCLNNEFLLD